MSNRNVIKVRYRPRIRRGFKIQNDCQFAFVGMKAPEGAQAEVRAWMDRLGALTSLAIKVEVHIEITDEQPQQRQDRRNRQNRIERLHRVRLTLTMPDGVVAVAFNHPSNAAHEDLYVAIRNAFRAARRQLESNLTTRSLAERAGENSPGVLPRDFTFATNAPVIPGV